MTLEILTSDSLAPIRHGFFTRKGGASSGVFQGLNCGTGSTDQSAVVAINRERAAAAMGLGVAHLVTVNQVHSADVVTLDSVPAERARADAMVTRTPGLGLAILTADCQPVLFADRQAYEIIEAAPRRFYSGASAPVGRLATAFAPNAD